MQKNIQRDQFVVKLKQESNTPTSSRHDSLQNLIPNTRERVSLLEEITGTEMNTHTFCLDHQSQNNGNCKLNVKALNILVIPYTTSSSLYSITYSSHSIHCIASSHSFDHSFIHY